MSSVQQNCKEDKMKVYCEINLDLSPNVSLSGWIIKVNPVNCGAFRK